MNQTQMNRPTNLRKIIGRLPIRHCPRTQRGLTISLMAVCLSVLIGFPTAAQPTPTPTPTSPLSPPGSGFFLNLRELGSLVTAGGGLDQAIVYLDGRRLFAIAAPQVQEQSQTGNLGNPAELRVQTIEDRLQRIIINQFDPNTLEVFFEIDQASGLPIISARYRARGQTHTDELLTITSLDAQIHGTDPATWAKDVIEIVAPALKNAHQERQPESLRQQTLWAASLLVGILAFSLVLTCLQRRLQRDRRRLSVWLDADTQQQADLVAEAAEPRSTGTAAMATSLLKQEMRHRQQRGINDIQRRLLQVLQLIGWSSGLFLILGLFPYSRPLQPVLFNWMQVPLKILGIAIITYLLIRLGSVLVDRFLLVVQNSVTLAPDVSQRVTLRFSTFSRVIKGILAFLLMGGGIITALSVIGVQVGPLLAGAGIIGLAISFASQSLIKDILNGFLILLEDQYGVGDVIAVEDVSGLVENMNLRITQLRNEEGRLITIPNSAITIVQNLSKEWSRVALQIDVAYTADVDQALAIIDEVAQDMSHDRYWDNLILEKPSLLGVDKLDYTGVSISLWIKTQPLKQWEVAREYRRRLKVAFDRTGIAIGVPQQSLWFGNALDVEEVQPPVDQKRSPNPPQS